MNKSELKQLIREELKNPKKADLNKDGKLSSYEEKRGAAIEKNLKENLNPEVINAVDRFIKAMAKRYGYEEQDAIYVIQQAISQRNSGLDEELYTPNEMADKAVEDESNGPGY